MEKMFLAVLFLFMLLTVLFIVLVGLALLPDVILGMIESWSDLFNRIKSRRSKKKETLND